MIFVIYRILYIEFRLFIDLTVPVGEFFW